jgi:hypothetical protein
MYTAIYFNGERFFLINKHHLELRADILSEFLINNNYELVGYGEF